MSGTLISGSRPLTVASSGKSPPRLDLGRLAPEWSQLAGAPSVVDLAANLAAELEERLPYFDMKEPLPRRGTAFVNAYVGSLGILRQCQEDFEILVRQVLATVLEFRQGTGETDTTARDEALKEKLAEMLKQASSTSFSVPNVLNANVASLPVATLYETLARALRKNTIDFSEHFFQMLAQLVEQKRVGLVSWTGSNTCEYFYFKAVVIQEDDGTQVSVGQLQSGAWITQNGQTTNRHQQVRTITKGRHLYCLARHEHHVMNAFHTTLHNTQVVVPDYVQPLIDKIPGWLYPFVRVIDGTLVRERVIEIDQAKKEWQRVSEVDVPVFGPEPGISVGPYILCGWGPTEIAGELARRESSSAD